MALDSDHHRRELVEAHRQLRDRDEAFVSMQAEVVSMQAEVVSMQAEIVSVQAEIESRDEQIASLRTEVDRVTKAFEDLCATRAVKAAQWFWSLKTRALTIAHRGPPDARP